MEKEIRPVLEGRYAEYEKRTEENRKLMENYARGVEELKKKGLEACVTEKVFESQEAKEEYANYLMNILDGSAHALAETLDPEGYAKGVYDAFGNFHYKTNDGGRNMITSEGVILER